MPDWESEDIRTWKREVKEDQQGYCDLLCDREFDEVPIADNLLRRKVGYALFGVPNNAGNDVLGYADDQILIIDKACNKLIELQNNNSVIKMSSSFVMCKIFEKRFVFPVIRGFNADIDKYHFIDMNVRVYDSWQDFLKNNTLPKCIYCYTKNGFYHVDDNDNVQVEYGTSPACDFTSKTAGMLDYTGMLMGIGCTVVGVASMFIPVVGPIAATALYGGVTSGVYGIARSTTALVDRGSHGQSIGLKDSESRNCWLGIVGGCLSFGAMGSMSYVAKSASQGYVVGLAGRTFANTMQVSSLTMNGLGILNSTFQMKDKYDKNELTTLDIFQFTTSILFFSNSVVSMKTATSVIKEVQANVIKDYKSGLEGRSAKNAFAKLARKTRGKEGMHGNAKVIRSIKNINNPKEFFSSLTAVQKDIRGHNVKLTENGLINVNKELIVHPTKFQQIPEEMRIKILTATKDLSFSNTLSRENFKIQMASICSSEKIQFETQRNQNRRIHSDNTETYHYSMHMNDFPGETMSIADYYQLASELTGQPISEDDSILGQEEDTTFVAFTNENGARAVLVMNHSTNDQNTSGIATMIYDIN